MMRKEMEISSQKTLNGDRNNDFIDINKQLPGSGGVLSN